MYHSRPVLKENSHDVGFVPPPSFSLTVTE